MIRDEKWYKRVAAEILEESSGSGSTSSKKKLSPTEPEPTPFIVFQLFGFIFGIVLVLILLSLWLVISVIILLIKLLTFNCSAAVDYCLFSSRIVKIISGFILEKFCPTLIGASGIPSSVQFCTADYMTKQLMKSGHLAKGNKVTEVLYKTNEFGGALGYSGFLKMKFQFPPKHDAFMDTVFVKLSDPELENRISLYNCWVTEIKAYDTGLFESNAPHFFFSQFNKFSVRGIICLEAVQNKIFKELGEATVEDITKMVEYNAEFAAKTYGFDSLKEHGLVNFQTKSYTANLGIIEDGAWKKDQLIKWLTDNSIPITSTVRKLIGLLEKTGYVNFSKWVEEKYQKEGYVCAEHGDFHIKNTFFDKDDGSLGIIDFQLCRHGNPSADFPMIAFSINDEDTMRKSLDLWIDTFVASFNKFNPDAKLTREKYVEGVKFAAIARGILNLLAMKYVFKEEGDEKVCYLLLRMLSMFFALVEQTDALKLVPEEFFPKNLHEDLETAIEISSGQTSAV